MTLHFRTVLTITTLWLANGCSSSDDPCADFPITLDTELDMSEPFFQPYRLPEMTGVPEDVLLAKGLVERCYPKPGWRYEDYPLQFDRAVSFAPENAILLYYIYGVEDVGIAVVVGDEGRVTSAYDFSLF